MDNPFDRPFDRVPGFVRSQVFSRESIPHDFRRTAVRALERAAVSRSAAMAMTGHLTESVYRRYAIADEPR
jgi:hypothetical protein